MSLITVDQEKCKRDGICAEVCPVGIIGFKDKDAFPSIIDGGDKLCIRCGHCVAVCPHGAMSHAIMKPEKCQPVNDDWL
ncbi:MAG: 4Fe-4S binding protein, partial [Desulfobacteraceae bacterium]|nr:4Fe-4S binding protein [Desulfobacteraceae bacterium]